MPAREQTCNSTSPLSSSKAQQGQRAHRVAKLGLHLQLIRLPLLQQHARRGQRYRLHARERGSDSAARACTRRLRGQPEGAFGNQAASVNQHRAHSAACAHTRRLHGQP